MSLKNIISLIFLLLFYSFRSSAQEKLKFFEPDSAYNASRTWILGGSGALIYGTALIGLNQAWYANYPRSAFHFFNDNHEWNQMDKMGHMFTPYFEATYAYMALKWAGVNNKKAAIYAGSTGFFFQTVIEILDGFSAKWGASPGDLIANTSGALLFTSQQLLWNEQRILFKFSFHPVNNYDPKVQSRVDDIFGTSIQEKVLKDYNGQTYWLSTNIGSFLKNENHFPKWLNVSIGYGAEGMLGASDNIWGVNDQENYSHIKRVRQFYISPDIDLTRIKVKSGFVRSMLFILNVIKVPAPAIEFGTNGVTKVHLFYF